MHRQDSVPDVGQRLLAARLNRGLTQSAAAGRAGVTTSYLSRVETGKIHPTFRNVVRIARGLELPLDELVAPERLGSSRGAGCPVHPQGTCMLDAMRAEQTKQHGAGEYSPRQIKMLRRFAAWLDRVSPERLEAMEVLLDELLQPGSSATESRRSDRFS